MGPLASHRSNNVISARQLVQYLAASGTWDEPFDPPRFALALRDLILAALEAGDDELVDSLQAYAASAGVCRDPDLRARLAAPRSQARGMPLLHLAAVLQAFGGSQQQQLIAPLATKMPDRDLAGIAGRLALAALSLCNLELFSRFMRAAELLDRQAAAAARAASISANAEWSSAACATSVA